MRWVFDDGGRVTAGYRGHTGDCTCRAIAIATSQPYQEVYNALNVLCDLRRALPYRPGRKSSARTGVPRRIYEPYLWSLGWRWTPTMQIGSGCRVHLKAEELPAGRLIVRVSKHHVAVINGVIHDTFDCSRDETRCVYGFWAK